MPNERHKKGKHLVIFALSHVSVENVTASGTYFKWNCFPRPAALQAFKIYTHFWYSLSLKTIYRCLKLNDFLYKLDEEVAYLHKLGYRSETKKLG